MNVIERIAEWHMKLCGQPAYKQYMTAETDDGAVEGSLGCDTHEAARMLRRAAARAIHSWRRCSSARSAAKSRD